MSVLRRLFVLWAVLIALAVFGSVRLVSWVDLIDKKVWVRFEQPVWSEDETQVAFIRYQIDPAAPTKEVPGKELWVAQRVDGESHKVADLAEQDLKLLGWIDGDKRLLLMQPHPEGTLPRLWTVSMSDGVLQESHFGRTDVELVSISGGQVFFRRRGEKIAWEVPSSVAPVGDGTQTPTPTPTAAASPSDSPSPGLTREQLDLLSWSPGQNSLSHVCSFPIQGDDLQIEDAVPSPDNKWVAIVLRVGEEKALWLYSRKDDQLRYTHIKLSARALRLAWSWDSTGLVAAVELAGGCDFYVSSNVATGDFTVLHANAPGRAYQPFWPRGDKEFLLLDRGEILRFDPVSLQAQQVMGRSFQGKRTENSAISPRGSWIVFRSREGHDDVLYTVSLKVREAKALLKATPQTADRSSVYYLVGDGLRSAFRYWKREPMPVEDQGIQK